MYVTSETIVWGGREWETFRRAKCGGLEVVEVVEVVEWRVTLGRTALMPSPDAAARHTGAGVARRQAHHERMRDERAREAAAGDAELPPEDDAVEMASAAQLLDSVAEVGPNYTLLRSKETKAKRRKRQREDARAALDGHTVLSTGSRLEIFCDSERWYPATVMAREDWRRTGTDGSCTRSSTTATRIGGGGTCWTTSGGAPSQSRPARPLSALGSEDWWDAIHAGVFSGGRPSVHGVAPRDTLFWDIFNAFGPYPPPSP